MRGVGQQRALYFKITFQLLPWYEILQSLLYTGKCSYHWYRGSTVIAPGLAGFMLANRSGAGCMLLYVGRQATCAVQRLALLWIPHRSLPVVMVTRAEAAAAPPTSYFPNPSSVPPFPVLETHTPVTSLLPAYSCQILFTIQYTFICQASHICHVKV